MQKRDCNGVSKLEIERPGKSLWLSFFFLSAASSFDHLASQRKTFVSSPSLPFFFLSLFSHLRESWRVGIEATREDVREEHCIIKSGKREGLREKRREEEEGKKE